MTANEIIVILRAHEQVVYLPKGVHKNPLTYGIIKQNFKKVAEEIAAQIQANGKSNQAGSSASFRQKED